MADPVQGISAAPYEDNARYFAVSICGPNDSPYQSGVFKMELFLPADYPMAPPKVRFLTKMYATVLPLLPCTTTTTTTTTTLPTTPRPHRFPLRYHPNVDKLGRICLDILKDKWSPALQIRTVLLSIQALMSSPNPDDPLDTSVAEHWKTDEAGALAKAAEYTAQYAPAPKPKA